MKAKYACATKGGIVFVEATPLTTIERIKELAKSQHGVLVTDVVGEERILAPDESEEDFDEEIKDEDEEGDDEDDEDSEDEEEDEDEDVDDDEDFDDEDDEDIDDDEEDEEEDEEERASPGS